MDMKRVRVGFGFLGTTLDAYGGFGQKRHEAWRPTVSLGLNKALGLSRLELWYNPRYLKLASLIKKDIENGSRTVTVTLHQAPLVDPWSFEEMYGFLYDFINGYKFRPEEEEYYVHLTTGTHVAQICLFLLTETRHFPAKLVQTNPRNKEGCDPIAIIDLDLSQYDKLAKRFEQKLSKDLEVLKDGVKTRSREFNKTILEIEQVARVSSDPILLLGPTGAGKSHLAKQIYRLKRSQNQVQGEFVDINCATIRGEQAMSTLFGHIKGAFTGALSRRDGLLKKADKGLLFLDEIGELGLDEQAMLLRAIEEKCFFPLGADKEEHSDFELITGTNRDLIQATKQGRFREDLLRRIDLWKFSLPALKDRLEDIEPNIDYELKKFEQRSGRRVSFNASARSKYISYATSKSAMWPGNFRDLNASITRMGTLSAQGRINEDVVSAEIERLSMAWLDSESFVSTRDNADIVLNGVGIDPRSIDLFERDQLATVIVTLQNNTSIAAAGRELFAKSRKSKNSTNDSDRLRKYLSRFGIDAKKILGSSAI